MESTRCSGERVGRRGRPKSAGQRARGVSRAQAESVERRVQAGSAGCRESDGVTKLEQLGEPRAGKILEPWAEGVGNFVERGLR